MKTYSVMISFSNKVYMALMKLRQRSKKQKWMVNKTIFLFFSLEYLANFTAA